MARTPGRRRSRAATTRLVDPVAGWAAAEVEAALTPPADPTAAAFFDVDNTMMQGASIYYFARGLAARKYFTTGDLIRFALQQMRFRVLASEHAGDVSQAKEAALAFVAGWRVDDMQRLSEEIFDELMAERIWSGTRALAARQALHSGLRLNPCATSSSPATSTEPWPSRARSRVRRWLPFTGFATRAARSSW